MLTFRDQWTVLTDAQLLAQCEVDTYRASGPGGQKRNKTSSAVRLRHLPSGLILIAEESRSQHENKAKALQRLRRALFLELRTPMDADRIATESLAVDPIVAQAKNEEGRLDLGKKDPRFWPTVGVVLDVVAALEGKISEAAERLGTTTGNLIAFLETHDKVFQAVNELRRRFGLKPLRAS